MNQTPKIGNISRKDIEGILSAAQRASTLRQAEMEFLISQFGKEIDITRETHSNGQVRYRLKEPFKNFDNVPGVWISQERAYEIVDRDFLNRMDAYFYLAEKIA